MKIFDFFIKKICDKISKTTIVDDCEETKKDLDVCVQSYASAETFFKVTKFSSPEVNSYSKEFMSLLEKHKKLPKAATFIGEISQRLTNVQQNLIVLSNMAEEIFEKNIFSESLTVQQAVVMRGVSSISWASRYAIDLLNFIYRSEEINRLKEGRSVSEDEIETIPPAIYKMINDGGKKFASVLNIYGVPNEEFMKSLSVSSTIVINSKTKDNLSKVYTELELDPFAHKYASGFIGSPIYMVRMAIAAWQVERHNARKEKKKQLELRLLHLRALADKKNDIKLEREIEYLQNRIDKMDAHIRDVEGNLNIED